VLMIVVDGNTQRLIPLFAIGVFTGFTLSQTGLVVHWRRTRPPHWLHRAVINGTGAVVTAAATIIFLGTKFTAGAWVVVIAVPAFMFLFSRIHRYYQWAGRAMGLGTTPGPPRPLPSVVVVPVVDVSRPAQHAISEALSLSDDVIAVTVAIEDPGQDGDPARDIQEQWARWNPGPPLKVLRTEYSSIAAPILAFLDELHAQRQEQIVVLIPVAVPDRGRYRLLQNHYDLVLSNALRDRPYIIAARVPMSLHVAGEETRLED
jgi:hypothetical protein